MPVIQLHEHNNTFTLLLSEYGVRGSDRLKVMQVKGHVSLEMFC